MARRGRRSSALSRAQQEAIVRFGPEQGVIQQLLADAESSRTNAERSAVGTARGIQQAAKEGRPRLERTYRNPIGAAGTQLADPEQTFQGLGSAADPFRAASRAEAAGAKRRLEESLANALKELTNREVSAKEGAVSAVRQAHAEYRENVGKLASRLQGLAREQGAFTSARTAEIEDTEATRDFDQGFKLAQLGIDQKNLELDERKTIAQITGTDPVTGLPYQGDDGKGGKNRLSPAEARQRRGDQQSVVDDIGLAETWMRRLRQNPKNTWTVIMERLRAGDKIATDDGTEIQLPTIKNRLVLLAGAELAEHGRLTRGTYRRLWSEAGVPRNRIPRDWHPPNPPKGSTRRPPNAAGPGRRGRRPT